MSFDRRLLLTAGLGITASAAAALAGERRSRPAAAPADRRGAMEPAGLAPDDTRDQSLALQAAIDEAAHRGVPLVLPAGTIRAAGIVLRAGTRLIGAHGATTLLFAGGPSFLTAEVAPGITIEDLSIDGGSLALDPAVAEALLSLAGCSGLAVRNVAIARSLLNGIALKRCAGAVTGCSIAMVSQAAIASTDAEGLDIVANRIAHCGNNGILVWRERPGEDGTLVTGNRIEHVAARAGGSGENGNGINVFKAGGVIVSNNRIRDCAYSAVRCNSASNLSIVGNSASRIGEVALYAEFAFEGALIASNLIEDAASGIEVTNFNEGGRLAVVQGNLIRRLKRREQEPEDKRGDGIGVEADCVVTGNVIEDAPNAGIVVGWGEYMRNCQVTANLVRNARYGVLVSSHPAAGACLVSSNMITGAREGAVRLMDHGLPLGPDLALAPPATGRVSVTGNVVA